MDEVDTSKETPVTLSQEEAVELIDKLISWTQQAQEDPSIIDWNDFLEESLKLEKKLEKARGADFVGRVLKGEFRRFLLR